MKLLFRELSCILVLLTCFFSSSARASESDQRFTHVTVVWLKNPGDPAQRQKFLDISRKLNHSPGIISRHVGIVNHNSGHGVDSSYDVAVSVTLENEQAMDTYMNSSLHQQLIKKQLHPIIRKMITYNFNSQ